MRPSHPIAILDREFVSTAAEKSTPVMVWGPPGIGKSQIVAQVAKQHDVPVIDIRLSQMEPTDLRGIPFRDGDSWEVADRVVRESGKPNSDAMVGHVLRYAKLFAQRELGIMLVSDLQRALGSPLLESPEFSDWAAALLISSCIVRGTKLSKNSNAFSGHAVRRAGQYTVTNFAIQSTGYLRIHAE